MGDVLHIYPVGGESQIQRDANREVGTLAAMLDLTCGND